MDWSYKLPKNTSTSSSSQSCNYLTKFGLQLSLSQTSTTQASFEEAIEYRIKNKSLKGVSPHYSSIQNFTLSLKPTLRPILSLSVSQPPLITFHTPTPYPCLTSLVHHPAFLQPILSYIYPFPKRVPFTHKAPKPFSQRRFLLLIYNYHVLNLSYILVFYI